MIFYKLCQIHDVHCQIYDGYSFFLKLRDPIGYAAEKFAEADVNPVNIGSMDMCCFSCGALMFPAEVHRGSGDNVTFSLCCSYGKVRLPEITSPPASIKQLFESNGPLSKEFKLSIRTYNSAFALSSVGVELGSVFKFDRGPWTYKITGQVYHSLGPILPSQNQSPSFSQLYVYEPENELQNRKKRCTTMNDETLKLIQSVMHQHNPYVMQYKKVTYFKLLCYLKYISHYMCGTL